MTSCLDLHMSIGKPNAEKQAPAVFAQAIESLALSLNTCLFRDFDFFLTPLTSPSTPPTALALVVSRRHIHLCKMIDFSFSDDPELQKLSAEVVSIRLQPASPSQRLVATRAASLYKTANTYITDFQPGRF